jgi:hypothetical protein
MALTEVARMAMDRIALMAEMTKTLQKDLLRDAGFRTK